MIIHWRSRLNSAQNAVGYMIKPTIAMMFSITSTTVSVSPILLHTTTATRRTHETTATRRTHATTATRRTHETKINEP